MTTPLNTLQHRLGHTFARPWLLLQALTHRSFATEHNERLEFLGDTVLNLAVTQLLFERYPATTEGDLSRSRASLVRQETLHQIAQAIAVSAHMKLGDGEVKSGGYTRPSMLADTVEALLGAVFLDSNYDTAYQVVVRLYTPLLTDFEPGSKQKDSKSALQEALQGAKLALPEYILLSTQGAAHQQAFEVLCKVEAWQVEAVGIGASRKIAEQEAASAALLKKPASKAKKPKTTGTTIVTTTKPKQMKLKVAAEQVPT